MTNQEAIKIILTEWNCIDRNDGVNCDRKCENCDLVMDSEQIRQAYNLAIKALETQELTKLNQDSNQGDLISREWLRKASCKIELTADEAYYCTIGREKVLDLIDNAPTVNKCDNCDLMFMAKTRGEKE